MSDPYAGPDSSGVSETTIPLDPGAPDATVPLLADATAPLSPDPSDATIPLVPDAGYAETDLVPFAEETLVDPLRRTGSATTGDPWASGPGLGEARGSRPASAVNLQPTSPYPPPAAYPAPAPRRTPVPQSYQQPPYGEASPRPDAAAVAPTATAAASHGPSAQSPYAQSPYAPGSYSQAPYAQAPWEQGNQAQYPQGRAAGSYPGPQWPAVVEPNGYDLGYGYAPPPATSTHPSAAASMVLGILGLAVFSPLSPIAWYLAARGRREMRADPYRWQPSGMLTAGLVLGIIGTAFLALAALFVMLFGMMFLAFAV